ncbi:hypothetical protein ABZ816_34770 [Actinosynnema sp. NPDC047251]|uniref:hypothetical protein n=1 Tax=Saccharothrix espanaensis TaxID=103731 RepID=UPI0002EF368F|nr:hypothetical protein [Saccharothrix espanaensis]
MGSAVFGDRASFGVVVKPADVVHGGGRGIRIFVTGVDFTVGDDQVYVPHFLFSVGRTIDALRDWPDLTPYEAVFGGRDPKVLHEKVDDDSLDDSALPKYFTGRLAFMEWGEITFGFRSYLFRFGDRAWLTCRAHAHGSALHVVPIDLTVMRDLLTRAHQVVKVDYEAYRARIG